MGAYKINFYGLKEAIFCSPYTTAAQSPILLLILEKDMKGGWLMSLLKQPMMTHTKLME